MHPSINVAVLYAVTGTVDVHTCVFHASASATTILSKSFACPFCTSTAKSYCAPASKPDNVS